MKTKTQTTGTRTLQALSWCQVIAVFFNSKQKAEESQPCYHFVYTEIQVTLDTHLWYIVFM